MKRTKREENAIVIHFLFYSLLVLGLIIVTIGYIYPNIRDLEVEKKEVISLYEEIETIKNKGIDFETFKGQFNSSDKKNDDSIYLEEIFKELDENFYKEHFNNKTEGLYDNFIKEIKDYYLNSNDNIEQDKIVAKILPIYSENINEAGENQLTDYIFVNYLESIIETFNLSYKDGIGASKKISIEKFNLSKDINSLDSKIYLIPVSLKLNGTKRDILQFLYFIENVGNIYIGSDDDKIFINKEFKYISKKVIKGSKKTKDYNIFNNQIIDIDRISFKKDFDSSFTNTQGRLDFIDYIIFKQGNELIDIEIDLSFYVKGIPSYKIKNEIDSVLKDFGILQKFIKKNLARKDLSKNTKLIFLDYNTTFAGLNKEIQGLRKKMSNPKEFEKAYDESFKYKKLISETLKDIEIQTGITMK